MACTGQENSYIKGKAMNELSTKGRSGYFNGEAKVNQPDGGDGPRGLWYSNETFCASVQEESNDSNHSPSE